MNDDVTLVPRPITGGGPENAARALDLDNACPRTARRMLRLVAPRKATDPAWPERPRGRYRLRPIGEGEAAR
jgi:hypothetical protein